MIDFVDALVFVLSRLQGLFVTVSIVSLMAALGTRLTQGDVVGTIRQYNLISRWALANLLAVPLFALLLGSCST
ncbi:hypothetical protein [Halobaculum limi]|uniref:hypothetical protein n=1 Tax=Halobaculum limi TaxID=3031916 RepID=UPI002405A333|nr:hypothetical protein [Halobaculum sp. YSMS11]